MRLRAAAFCLASTVVAVAVAACGSRSALDVPPPPDRAAPDGPASMDDAADASAQDVASMEPMPSIDAAPPPDAAVCPGGVSSVAYLVSQSAQLYTFDPATLATRLVGPLACPSANGVPWTLTVATGGRAYLMYEDWDLYEVDLSTLACARAAYVPGQLGLVAQVGITVAPDAGSESLYYLGAPAGAASLILAVSDLTTFSLAEVGPVAPTPTELVLDIRADAFGRIFGLGQHGTLVQIDPATGQVVAEDATGFDASNWALLAYGTDLYFFSGSDVSRYDLGTQQLTALGNIGVQVVGASAAPCLP